MVDTDETQTLYLVDDSNKRAWIFAPNQAWMRKQRALRAQNNNEGKKYLLGIDISQDQLDRCLKAGMAMPVDYMLAEREGFVPGPEAPELQLPKEVATGQRSPMTMSKKGLWWVFGSAYGGLVLMTRVETILGTRIFITSGNPRSTPQKRPYVDVSEPAKGAPGRSLVSALPWPLTRRIVVFASSSVRT